MGSLINTDFQFDAANLGEEWSRQPLLYMKYARAAADARREMDESKNVLEVVKSEIALSIRNDHGSYGLIKVTEALLIQAVQCHADVKAAMEEVVDARHSYEVLLAAVGSMDHKKKALENAVSLFLAGYYSEPKAKEGDREGIEEIEKTRIRRKR